MGRCSPEKPELRSESVWGQETVANFRNVRLPALRVGVHLLADCTPGPVTDALERAGIEAVALAPDAAPVDAVVLAATTGSELAAESERILAEHPTLPVIGVVVRLRPNDVRGALNAGLSAILELAGLEDTLGIAVRGACAGLVTVPRWGRQAAAGPVLSVREKQVLAMVVLGFTNAEIARKLFVAESTVKSHLSSAFVKLGVRSRNEATAVILDQTSGLGTGVLAITDTGARTPSTPTPA